MEKRLIKFHEHNHNKELKFANIDLSAYNTLLSTIKPHLASLNIQLDKDLICALLKNAKGYAFDTVVGDNPLTLGGAPISKQKAMEFIEMPSDWVAIIKAVEDFNKELVQTPFHKERVQDVGGMSRIGLEKFEILDEVFVMKSEHLTDLKEKHSIYTNSEKQNQVHDELIKIYEGFEKLKKNWCFRCAKLARDWHYSHSRFK